MRALVALALALALSAVAGCGGGDPITRFQRTYDGLVDYSCRTCPGTTEADCRMRSAGTNPFVGPEWDCQRDAYDRYSSELGPTYDCVERAVSGYDTCMRAAIGRSCPPASGEITTCNTEMNEAIERCPRPDSIEASMAVAACF